MVITNGTTQYRIGRLVAEAAAFRLYICKDVAADKQYLLQVAAQIEHNSGLDRAAFVLKKLKQTSDLYETEYAKVSEGRMLNYDRLFPGLVDSFICDEQGKRRVNILTFKDIDSISMMVPLSNLINKDRLRIDLETSAWIMGRLLKLLAFTHGQGITVGMLTGNNVLISPSNHFVVVLDWSAARTFQREVPLEDRRADIARAAQAVFAAIGGDPATQDYPYSTDDNRRYVEHLMRLASRREGNAERAHANFYKLVYELFGKGFRPFTTLPL